jgi:hypothetical protein
LNQKKVLQVNDFSKGLTSRATSKLQLQNPEEEPSVDHDEVNQKAFLKSTTSNKTNNSDKLSTKGPHMQQE